MYSPRPIVYLLLLSFFLANWRIVWADTDLFDVERSSVDDDNGVVASLTVDLDEEQLEFSVSSNNFEPVNMYSEIAQRMKAFEFIRGDAVDEIRQALFLRMMKKYASSVPSKRCDGSCTRKGPIMLHIGGGDVRSGRWTVLDASDDISTNHQDLVRGQMDKIEASGFENHTVDAIYASHVLEHAHLPTSELSPRVDKVLERWRAALKTGGMICIGVPNMKVIMDLMQTESPKNKQILLSFLFGGQKNVWDVHYMGFDSEILTLLLRESGFCNIREYAGGFGIFSDTTTLTVRGKPVSLNIGAIAC